MAHSASYGAKIVGGCSLLTLTFRLTAEGSSGLASRYPDLPEYGIDPKNVRESKDTQPDTGGRGRDGLRGLCSHWLPASQHTEDADPVR